MNREEFIDSFLAVSAKLKADANHEREKLKEINRDFDYAKLDFRLRAFSVHLELAFPAYKDYDLKTTFSSDTVRGFKRVIEVLWPVGIKHDGHILSCEPFHEKIEYMPLGDGDTLPDEVQSRLDQILVLLIKDMNDWLDFLCNKYEGMLPARIGQVSRGIEDSGSQAETSADEVVTPREADDSAQKESLTSTSAGYLGIKISEDRSVTFQSETCEFKGSIKAFDLTRILFNLGNSGGSKTEVSNSLYGNDKLVTPDALRKQKDTANEILSSVGLEIESPYRQNRLILKPIKRP